MHVFLSDSFLHRLSLFWKPDLNAFLVGERNLFFFAPDFAVETQQLDADAVDRFLHKCSDSHLQLLGFLSSDPVSLVPGFLRLQTDGSQDPRKWTAQVCLVNESGHESIVPLEIRLSGGTVLPS